MALAGRPGNSILCTAFAPPTTFLMPPFTRPLTRLRMPTGPSAADAPPAYRASPLSGDAGTLATGR